MVAGELSFGEFLQQLRKRKHLSVEQLADRAGCGVSTVHAYEQGKRRPRHDTAEGLARGLGVPEAFGETFVRAATAQYASLDPLLPLLAPSPTDPRGKHAVRTRWGEAPAPTALLGRDAEAHACTARLNSGQTGLLLLLGMGGVGKTALAAQVARTLADEFDAVLWLSLRNTPSPQETLAACVSFFAGNSRSKRAQSFERGLEPLLEVLGRARCLLILDNAEAVVQSGALQPRYREGYDDYGRLLSSLAQRPHRSCVIVTSRELPPGLPLDVDANGRLWVAWLDGLAEDDGVRLLKRRGVQHDAVFGPALVRRYSGNPLALLIVADYICELFAGQAGRFLQADALMLGEVRALLEGQFARLAATELLLLSWLAVMREPATFAQLREVMAPPAEELLDALHALRRRSLVEAQGDTFTLQNIVMEYVTFRLVSILGRELRERHDETLHRLLLARLHGERSG
jgi:transcriptional regulator with XRE-family HTH domain